MNDELKRNIWGGVNRSNNRDTLDLQLFSSVNNPYTFTLDGDYNINATIESNLVDLSYYARDNIPNYDTIVYIPSENIEYLNSGLKATNMEGMFYGCDKLFDFPELRNLDISLVTNMSYMFANIGRGITSSSIGNFFRNLFGSNSEINITNISHMFENSYLEPEFNTKFTFEGINILDTSYMFANTNCNFLDVGDLSTVQNMSYMFYNCSYMGNLNYNYGNSTIDMKSCVNYEKMFNGCSRLFGVKIKNPPAGFDGAGLKSSQYEIVS